MFCRKPKGKLVKMMKCDIRAERESAIQGGVTWTIPAAKLLLWGFIAVATTSQAQSRINEQKALFQKATAVWTAFQNKDMKTMQTLMSPNFVFIGKEGILSGAEVGAQNCTLHSFALKSDQMRPLGSRAAVLTYRAEQDYECNGQTESKELLVSDSFSFIDGKWLLVAHAEVAPAGPAMP
jgi:Domain of unknown function (DUF4440)